jgi:ribosomal protein L37AE/L43A
MVLKRFWASVRLVHDNHLTTSAEIDMTKVYHCKPCQRIMLRRDLVKGKCPRCSQEVTDITDSPLGNSWLQVVSPKASDRPTQPRKEKGTQ